MKLRAQVALALVCGAAPLLVGCGRNIVRAASPSVVTAPPVEPRPVASASGPVADPIPAPELPQPAPELAPSPAAEPVAPRPRPAPAPAAAEPPPPTPAPAPPPRTPALPT